MEKINQYLHELWGRRNEMEKINQYLHELWGRKKKPKPKPKNKLDTIRYEIMDVWYEALTNYIDNIIDKVTKVKYSLKDNDIKYGGKYNHLRDNIYQIIWVDDQMWEGDNDIDRSDLYKIYKPIYDKIYKEQLTRLIKYIPKIKLLWKQFIIEYDKQTKEGNNDKNWEDQYKNWKKYMSHSSRQISINLLDFDHMTGQKSGYQGGWDEEYDESQTIIYKICDFS